MTNIARRDAIRATNYDIKQVEKALRLIQDMTNPSELLDAAENALRTERSALMAYMDSLLEEQASSM
jgi:pyrroloquinoline quinone (PQQ) biosynthesis protein C